MNVKTIPAALAGKCSPLNLLRIEVPPETRLVTSQPSNKGRPEMRYLKIGMASIALGVTWLTGCGVSPSDKAAVLNVVDTNPSDWDILYGNGMPHHPYSTTSTSEGENWYIDLPDSSGSLNYVEVPFQANHELGTQTLTATFRIVSSDAVYNGQVDPNAIDPATFHLFIERQGDDLTNEYFRWWCGSAVYILGSNDNQMLTITCPLTYDKWTDVYGHRDQNEFQDTLNNIGWVGLTFGGSNMWGHGVNLLGGKARFELINYQIQSSDSK